MTANDRFFQTKRAAAVLKHGILSRYPTVFATMTGYRRSDGRVVYLDGYAGPGRYAPEGGSTEGAPGSPLIAIRTASTVQEWQRKLYCIFVERRRAYADSLRSVLAAEAEPDLSYEVLEGDVHTHIDHVLSVAGSSPLFAFLDPFGTALPYTDFRHKLLSRDNNLITEVLLNFNVQMVSRIGGYLTGEEEDEETTSTGRSATLARMDDFLGGAWWQDEFVSARRSDDEGSAARAALHIVEQFRRKVRGDTGFSSFPVPIRRKQHHHPLFVMLLFYRHASAPYQFNQSVSKANEDWRQHLHDVELAELLESLDDDQPNLFDMDNSYTTEYMEERLREAERKLQDEWIALIKENIRHHVENGPVLVEQRVADVHGTTLGLARELHLTRAWDQLAEEGIVLPRNKGQKARKQAIVAVRR